MEISQFLGQLKTVIAELDYVEQLAIEEIEEKLVKGTIYLQKNDLLVFRYNSICYSFSFSLLFNQQRIWGIDRDNRIGWHTHSLHNTDEHIPIEATENIAKIIEIFDGIWRKLE
jgi:hypothetical protein